MKSFRLFSLLSLVLVCVVTVVFAAPVIDLVLPALVPIALSVGVIAAATILAIRHLLTPAVSDARSSSVRLAFPTPQTGTPPASAFA